MKWVLAGTRWDGVDFICWAEDGDHWWTVLWRVITTPFIDIIQGGREFGFYA
jgi:hypothetical protein